MNTLAEQIQTQNITSPPGRSQHKPKLRPLKHQKVYPDTPSSRENETKTEKLVTRTLRQSLRVPRPRRTLHDHRAKNRPNSPTHPRLRRLVRPNLHSHPPLVTTRLMRTRRHPEQLRLHNGQTKPHRQRRTRHLRDLPLRLKDAANHPETRNLRRDKTSDEPRRRTHHTQPQQRNPSKPTHTSRRPRTIHNNHQKNTQNHITKTTTKLTQTSKMNGDSVLSPCTYN